MKKIKSLFKRDYTTRLVYDELVEGSEWVTHGYGVATIKWDGTCCMVKNGELYKRYDRKLKFGKGLKRQGYYLDFLEIGSVVSKVSRKPFQNKSNTDTIVAIELNHQYTGQPYAELANNPPVDLRQLKPIGVVLPHRFYKNAPVGWQAAEDSPNVHTGHWPGWVKVGDEPESKWHREAWELYVPDGLPDGTYELVGRKVQGNPYNFKSHWRHVLWQHGMTFDDKRIPMITPLLTSPPHDFDSLKEWFKYNICEGIVWHDGDEMVKIKRRDFGLGWPE